MSARVLVRDLRRPWSMRVGERNTGAIVNGRHGVIVDEARLRGHEDVELPAVVGPSNRGEPPQGDGAADAEIDHLVEFRRLEVGRLGVEARLMWIRERRLP